MPASRVLQHAEKTGLYLDRKFNQELLESYKPKIDQATLNCLNLPRVKRFSRWLIQERISKYISSIEMELEDLDYSDPKNARKIASREQKISNIRAGVYTTKKELELTRDINLGSPVDLPMLLYSEKGFKFPIIKYTKDKTTNRDTDKPSTDEDTLVVTLENPTAYFLKLLASHSYYPVSKKAVEAHENWAANAETIVSNGPYRLLSWKHNGEMDFIKNPNYWDAESVKTEKMNWPISESQSTRLTLVEGGEADMTVEPPVADQKRLEEAGLLHIGPMLGNYYYVFNVKAEPFTDPDVRKAFSMVINRANIVNNIVRGGKEPAYAFVPYGMLESNGREDFREAGSYLVYEDVEQAKEILKKAGYGKNRPLPQITILYNTSELHKAIAEAIQDAWINAFGADVRLQNQETKVFLADREAGKYQVARASWVADYSDPQNFLEVFSAEDNDGQYHSDEYNELIARIRTTPNGAARDALMHEAEKMIFDESLVMPLYFTTQPYVTNGTIQNYFWTTLGLVDFKKAYK